LEPVQKRVVVQPYNIYNTFLVSRNMFRPRFEKSNDVRLFVTIVACNPIRRKNMCASVSFKRSIYTCVLCWLTEIYHYFVLRLLGFDGCCDDRLRVMFLSCSRRQQNRNEIRFSVSAIGSFGIKRVIEEHNALPADFVTV